MRICIIIPTTAGPRLIQSITRLQNTPRSIMRASDDYVPLSTSQRYNEFLSPESPLSRAIGPLPSPCELRLTGGIETGRSWEVPVALAHWLMLAGHELVTDQPDAAIWATGALDTEMAVIEQDYHLDAKARESAQLMADILQTTTAVLVLSPRSSKLAETGRWPEGIVLHQIETLGQAMAAIENLVEGTPSPNLMLPKKKRPLVASLAGFVLFLSLVSWWAVTANIADAPQSEVAEWIDSPAQTDASANGVSLVVLRAPEERICDHVLRRMISPIEESHSLNEGHLLDLSYERLCGIAVALSETGERISFAFGLDFLDRTSMNQASIMQSFLNPGESHRYWFTDFVPPEFNFVLNIGPADGSSPGGAGWQEVNFQFIRRP